MQLAGEDRKNENGKPIPRADNTVRLELALLGHLFTIAIKEWGIGLVVNPVMSIRRPAPGPGRNRRLTEDEEKRLLAAVDAHSNPMLRWIVRVALTTGMRASEILTLRRPQVDLQRRVVRLLETKNTSPRTVPLSAAATATFREALNHPVRPIDTDLLFFGEPGRDGKRRPYQFNPVWLNIKRELKLTDVHFHDLRHEAVSRSEEGLRISLRSDTEFSRQVNAARKRLGRRVYFSTEKIAEIIGLSQVPSDFLSNRRLSFLIR
jgi:integrase